MRFLVLLGGAVAAFFVAAAVLFVLMVDPNKYKDDITRLVKAATGRELVFEGDVKLAFFPRLGIETGGVRLGNPPGFDDKPFSRVERASVTVRILPLLSGKVQVGRLALEGLQLHLQRDEAGRASWAGLVDDSAPAEATPWGLGDISLDGVRVTGASLLWEDRLSGERYALSGLDLEVKGMHSGSPSAFAASFQLESAKPELSGRAELSGTATLNAATNRHVFTDITFKLSATGKSVPGGKGDFALGLAELKIDEDKQTASGAGLSFAAYGAKATGQFQASNIFDGPDIKGRVDVPDFNGRALSAALTGKAPHTADAAAYEHITASLEFKTGRGYTEIPNFTARLDDAQVEGRFRVTGLDRKSYSFNLRVSGLDADRFLPPSRAEGGQHAPAAHAAPAAKEAGQGREGLFPVLALRRASIDGKITAERVKFKGLRLTSLTLPVMAQDGVLDIGQVDARLYEGALKGFLRLDVQGERPAVTLSTTLAGVQQKPLFSDLSGKESEFAGVMTLDTVSPLVCQGDSAQALKRSLSGRVRIAVRDGVFPGVNMLGVVRDSGRKGQEALSSAGAEAGTAKSTRFGSIDATAAITGGVAAINDLDIKAPFLRADGRGTVDIPSKHTDMTLRLRVVPSAEGQGGSAGLLGLAVPLRATGPYDDLSFGTDYLRTIGKGALDAVGGVVQGIGNVLTGGGSTKHQGGTPQKSSGGLLDGVKKLF